MLQDNLNLRLRYQGGNQQQRMNQDKLRGLKKALLYSYQAATLVTEDGREYRCLINPDKLKNDYDQKILSIPFDDIQLNAEMEGTTTQGTKPTGISTGQVFHWKETNTYWLIYLRNLEETAYFRADIRRCKQEVEINGHKYKIYIRGPVETTIPWDQKKKKTWNTINYSLLIYITKNEETLDFFHRFAIVKINDKPWEVKAVDSFGADDIIEVSLGETFSNPLEDEEGLPVLEIQEPDKDAPHIKGDTFIKPYAVQTYTVHNVSDFPDGHWLLNTDKVKFVSKTNDSVTIEVLDGKSFDFKLKYTADGLSDIIFPIVVESF